MLPSCCRVIVNVSRSYPTSVALAAGLAHCPAEPAALSRTLDDGRGPIWRRRGSGDAFALAVTFLAFRVWQNARKTAGIVLIPVRGPGVPTAGTS